MDIFSRLWTGIPLMKHTFWLLFIFLNLNIPSFILGMQTILKAWSSFFLFFFCNNLIIFIWYNNQLKWFMVGRYAVFVTQIDTFPIFSNSSHGKKYLAFFLYIKYINIYSIAQPLILIFKTITMIYKFR